MDKEYGRQFILKNLMTSNEAAKELNLSKNMITHLVRTNKLTSFKKIPNGLLFYRPDIEDYKNNSFKIIDGKIMSDFRGSTTKSIEFIQNNIQTLSSILYIYIFFYEWDAAKNGFYQVNTSDVGENINNIITPTFVVIDENGDKLYTNGLTCGYGGTGPHGTIKILEQLTNINTQTLNTAVHSFKSIKLTNINNEWDLQELPSDYNNLRYENKLDYSSLFSLKEYKDKLIIVQNESYIDFKGTLPLVSIFKHFLPNPERLYIFNNIDEAIEYGYYMHNYRFGRKIPCNIIITDRNGNQLWLMQYLSESQNISKNPNILELIEREGFNKESVPPSNEILNWLKINLLSIKPKPLVIEK